MNLFRRVNVFGRRRPSRIGVRLFAFNLLVVFVPVAGILYLDVYEAQLLESQERGMVQQARVMAAALADPESLSADRVGRVLAALEEQVDARIRVFDPQGQVLGDSARFATRSQARAPDAYGEIANPRRRFLYRVGAAFASLRHRIGDTTWRVLSRGETSGATESVPAVPPEVRSALAGRYGAAVQQTAGQRSLTLSSAVPVRHAGRVTGAVVVSQSTYRILQALYDVRLRLFEIVLLSMAAAAALTWLASSTIVNPIVRLGHMAAALASRRTDLAGVFGRVDRKDEIGDLARNLEELAARLDAHITLLESFAADVSHEFRNPLAAIRTAAETVAAADSPEDRERFRTMLLRDVDRLEGLVTGVRELARVDTEISSERRTPVEIGALLKGVVEGRQTVLGVPVELRTEPRPILVDASAGPLTQVFENLVDNAASFSPSGVPVDVSVSSTPGRCRVTVRDHGPGIPEAHLGRVFDRFFSYRPQGDRREHMGLGLAIAKAIVTAYGGAITARNRREGGAEFEVELPQSGVASR
jgi:two-component system sensor histidine kinase ChvG